MFPFGLECHIKSHILLQIELISLYCTGSMCSEHCVDHFQSRITAPHVFLNLVRLWRISKMAKEISQPMFNARNQGVFARRNFQKGKGRYLCTNIKCPASRTQHSTNTSNRNITPCRGEGLTSGELKYSFIVFKSLFLNALE